MLMKSSDKRQHRRRWRGAPLAQHCIYNCFDLDTSEQNNENIGAARPTLRRVPRRGCLISRGVRLAKYQLLNGIELFKVNLHKQHAHESEGGRIN